VTLIDSFVKETCFDEVKATCSEQGILKGQARTLNANHIFGPKDEAEHGEGTMSNCLNRLGATNMSVGNFFSNVCPPNMKWVSPGFCPYSEKGESSEVNGKKRITGSKSLDVNSLNYVYLVGGEVSIVFFYQQ